MKKVYGIAAVLFVVVVATTLLSRNDAGTFTFLKALNLENQMERIGMFGILSIAAAFVIITGGIDLSIGSVVCVSGCMLPWLVHDLELPPVLAVATVLLLCAMIGLWHGLLVVGVGLQPFVVTLCGLLLYRGLMRAFTGDQTMGFGDSAESLAWMTERLSVFGHFRIPMPALILLVVAVVTALFLNRTVYGRHLMALGRNEEAARLSGVATARLKILAYVCCSMLAGLGGCLFVVDVGSAQASNFGSFFELYAIAGAVLGGVALRGGEASILGVVLGTALMQVLQNAINLVGDSNQLEFAVVGAVILIGAAADAGFRRLWQRRGAAGSG
ncbi:MAG: ABC transporter permease [Planctomycetota bacterium]|nr:ABC transporter permease [Planctomycetota bacterium]